MKKLGFVLALLAAFGAQAQTASTSSSGATAQSSPMVTSGNSTSESGAMAAANPNNANQQMIQLNTVVPEQQRMSSSSSSTSVQQENVHYSGSQTIRNVPGIAMSGPASGPCTGASGGLGLAGPGFGVGLNGSKVDDSCVVRENTRTLGQVYQALDSADPLKAEAKAAMLEGMAALRSMTAQIAANYQPKPAEKRAEVAAPAPTVAQAAANGEPTDPYIRARMGVK